MSFHSQIDSHILKEGYLWKMGRLHKSFKQRYFVLYDDRTISYFAKKCHSKSRSKAKGTIYLTQIQRVEFVEYIPSDKSSSLTNVCNIEHEYKSKPRAHNLLNISKSARNMYELQSSPLQSIEESTNVNGYNIISSVENIENNNIISSAEPPPNYPFMDLKGIQTQKRFAEIRDRTKSVSSVIENISKTQTRERALSQSPIMLTPSLTDTIECDINNSLLSLNINESLISLTTENMNKSDIVSCCISDKQNMDKNEESIIFEEILKNTKLGLKCNRRYSFGLIGNDRQWILSAENNTILKEWVAIFYKLCQSKPMLSDYFYLKKENKK
eukprot:174051_1